MTTNNPASRVDLTYGPFIGPSLKESLEAGPVTLKGVVTSYRMLEITEGLSPALNSARSETANFRIRLPDYLAIRANDSAPVAIGVDRLNGYQGPVELSLEIPKQPNLAAENPYYFLTSDPLVAQAGSNQATMLVRNGAAQRAGADVVVVRAKGDSTILNTLRVLSATAPVPYVNATHGNNLSRLIPGDTPRNPRSTPVVMNAGGGFAIDGNMTTAMRFEGGIQQTIRLDFNKSYTLKKVVLDWDPANLPVGDFVLSLSEFEVLDGVTTLAAANALPANVATNLSVANTGQRIEVLLPAGTAVRQAKLWTVQVQPQEVRLREIEFISQ
jgi:hypothetical protein